jgi:hypothetical protein
MHCLVFQRNCLPPAEMVPWLHGYGQCKEVDLLITRLEDGNWCVFILVMLG